MIELERLERVEEYVDELERLERCSFPPICWAEWPLWLKRMATPWKPGEVAREVLEWVRRGCVDL